MSSRTLRKMGNTKSPTRSQSISPNKYPLSINFKIPDSSAFTINSPPNTNKENVNHCESPIKRKPLIERYKSGDESVSTSNTNESKSNKHIDVFNDDEFDDEYEEDEVTEEPGLDTDNMVDHGLGKTFEDDDASTTVTAKKLPPTPFLINKDKVFAQEVGESFIDNVFEVLNQEMNNIDNEAEPEQCDLQLALAKYNELHKRLKINQKLNELNQLGNTLKLCDLDIEPFDCDYNSENIEEKFYGLLDKYENIKDQFLKFQETVHAFKQQQYSIIYNIKHILSSSSSSSASNPSKSIQNLDSTIIPNTKINLFEQLVFGELIENSDTEDFDGNENV